MGTNFYFFRPLTEEEENAIKIVQGLYSDPDMFTSPQPLSVPKSIMEATESLEEFAKARGQRYQPYWGDRYGNHIGKRSAAGTYCWDCKTTLCVGGIAYVHRSKLPYLNACPSCGKSKTLESLAESAGGLELGFGKPRLVKKVGVTSVCSWTWAVCPDAFRNWAKENPDSACIKNEYGDVTTASEFVQMLDTNCPIEFRAIGEEFS